MVDDVWNTSYWLRRPPYAVGSTPFSLRLFVFLVVHYLVVGVHHVVLVRLGPPPRGLARAGLRAGLCAASAPPPRPGVQAPPRRRCGLLPLLPRFWRLV